LSLHTTGVLGRLFAEALENAPREPEHALTLSGAGPVAAFSYASLPIVLPQWVAYTLYRWEMNIRMAAVLGFVGGGGLGQLLYFHLSIFQQQQAMSGADRDVRAGHAGRLCECSLAPRSWPRLRLRRGQSGHEVPAMSHRQPVRVGDRHAFDVLIDARSPAEFALDHMPGAINCPVLDDDERRIVGTVYKQHRRLRGAPRRRRDGRGQPREAICARRFADKPEKWKPLVYCWRGGMRSGSMVNVAAPRGLGRAAARRRL
jgi:rhodanese-related sulfurtransferase